jgi:hypothetical protein
VHGSIDALPIPGNALHRVILGQSRLPKPEEKSRPLPFLKMLMQGAGAAKRAGQCLPLNAGAQHIDDARKDLSRCHGFAPAANAPPIGPAFIALSPWNQRFHFSPKLIGNFPRFDLSHAGNQILLVNRDEIKLYLRISS